MKNATLFLILALILSLGFSGTLRAQGNTLLVGPTTLSFTYVGVGLQSGSQSLLVASSGGPLPFGAAASTSAGGSWLAVGPAGGTTPASLTVSINGAGLSAGLYRGTIALTTSGAANPTVLVPVVLTVRTTSVLAADPVSLSFQFQGGGGTPPATQKVTITSNGAPLGFLAGTETDGSGDWLQVSPAIGFTGGSIEVGVTPGDLAPGVYTGMVTVTASGANNSPLLVPVSLTVSASPFLTLGGGPLSFSFQIGTAAPLSQTVTVSSTGAALNYTVSAGTGGGGDWLVAGPAAGSTPGAIGVGVSTADLSPGTYRGFVTVAAAGAANTPQRVAVTLTVTSGPILTITPGTLTFDYQVGGAAPAAQAVTVAGGGNLINYTVATTTTSGGAWLAVGPGSGTTNGIVTAAVNTAGLAVGSYSGAITMTAPGAANSPQSIPVTLNVSRNPLVQASPAALSFGFQTGGSIPGPQNVALTSTGAPLTFNVAASTTTGGPWLQTAAPSGTTPAALSVQVTPAGLAAGTYTGALTLTVGGAGNSPFVIPVTLVVSDTALLAASPGAVVLGMPVSPQTVSLTSTDGTPLAYFATASSAGNWLQVSPRGGTTPSSLNVSANPAGLGPGTYTGSVTILAPTAANSPQTVVVTLVVAPALAATPAELAFQFQYGAAAPAAQVVALAGGSGMSYTAAVSTTTGGDWLRVTPSSGTTPGSLSVSVHPTGLVAGAYRGSITVTSPQASNTVSIPVRLTVSGTAVLPVVGAVVQGASFQPVSVAPGTIVTIFGSGIGPATGITLRLTAAGAVDTTLGETRVLFDNIAAPILYASSRQVSVVVPYHVAGQSSTRLQIEYQGTRSSPREVRVAEAAPGIFTMDSSGTGQGAILNENGTVNAFSNAAERGSVVVLYATGEGQTTPEGVDGQVTGSTLRHPRLPVGVLMGGLQAEVLYAGSAPGLVAGVLQVNARVPASIAPGVAVPVVITVGGASSQNGVTVAVR